MTIAYKSKDTDYMNMLKRAVLKGLEGYKPEQKTYTWHFIQKQVVLSDLHAFATYQLNRKIDFPKEGFNANTMFVFDHYPNELEMEALEKIIAAMKLKRTQVYVTYLNKTTPEDEHEIKVLRKVLDGEINVVKPSRIISFGYNLDYISQLPEDTKTLQTHAFQAMFEDPDKKKEAWKDIVDLVQN